MKRYETAEILWEEGINKWSELSEVKKVYLASEVDEVIMNMVSEFAETAKDYESDRVKDKEEIARLRKALEWYAPPITVEDFEWDMGKIAREVLAGKEGG